MVFKKLKEMFGAPSTGSDYVEIDVGREAKKTKVVVRPFVLRAFEDINNILNALREGYTIAVIDIKPLKTKDVIELKRAISKIKKTTEALEGGVAGFGENLIIVTPSFAEIYKGPSVSPVAKSEAGSDSMETY